MLDGGLMRGHHCSDEESEAEGGHVTCLRSHSCKGMELWLVVCS